MKILHLNVDAIYWNQVNDGLKTEEYRLKNKFWETRLLNKNFDVIYYKLGYPATDDFSKILVFPFQGFEVKKITHEKFGNEEVEVFAIKLG